MNLNLLLVRRLSHDFSALTEKAIKDLSAIIIRTELKKNEVFMKKDEIHDYIIYVEKGLIRFYYQKGKKEVTVQFGEEETFAICDESFFRKEYSELSVVALEPTIVYQFPYREFMILVEKHPDIARLYRRMLENLLQEARDQIKSFHFESAHDRYKRLMEAKPSFINRIPLAYIASYLLMSKETLSRVRSVMFNTNKLT